MEMEDKKSDFERLVIINDKLLNIIEKEIEKNEVPSSEVLDTLKFVMTMTIALNKEEF